MLPIPPWFDFLDFIDRAQNIGDLTLREDAAGCSIKRQQPFFCVSMVYAMEAGGREILDKMVFNFGLRSSILLIFFVHGLILGILLLARGRDDQDGSSGWLGLFSLLGCLYIAPFMLGYAGWYAHDGYRETLFYLPLQQVLLLGPVMYLYTLSLLRPGFHLTWKRGLHFLPAAAYLAYSGYIALFDLLLSDQIHFYADGQDKDLDPWYQVAGWLSMITYFILSLGAYRRYKREVYNILSYAEAVLFRWVYHFLLAFLAMLVLRAFFFLLNPEWGEFGRKFWYYLCFSILLYYITLNGYTYAARSKVFLWKKGNAFGSLDGVSSLPDFELTAEQASEEQQINDLEGWKTRLSQLMKSERLYENAGLTLLEVAERMDTTPRQVSQVVNQGFNLNFNDFVNAYRVEAFRSRIEAGEHHRKTLLGLALECGFNSKSTFNRAFKKYSGMTPKAFLARQTGAKT